MSCLVDTHDWPALFRMETERWMESVDGRQRGLGRSGGRENCLQHVKYMKIYLI